MKINWSLLLQLLRNKKYCLRRVAAHTGLSEAMLGKLSNGDTKRMFFEEGHALLDFASDVLQPEEMRKVVIQEQGASA